MKFSKLWRLSHMIFLTIRLAYVSKESLFISSQLVKLLRFSLFFPLAAVLSHSKLEWAAKLKEKMDKREKMKEIHQEFMLDGNLRHSYGKS